MTQAVRTPARPASPAAARDKSRGLEAELSAVLEALARAASSTAEILLSRARQEAATELHEARTQAERIMQEARSQGTESASRSAAMMSARTRRQAHEQILAVRRSVVETLRHRAAEAAERRAATPEGMDLIDHLRSVVHARVGLPPPPDSGERPGAVGVITAQSGNRRATASVEDLVDRVLEPMASEVESLWA